MPSQGLFTALAGFGRGLVDEAEARRVREERARLQAAAELKDRLAQERQTRLDQQALTQQGIENTRADASTALSMNKGGFSPWQAGTVNGEEAATAQAWPTAPATGGMAGSVLGAVAPVAQKLTLDQGIKRAKALAGAQGGYVKTGMSETERVREDDRAAKADALQASLAQARELAQQRTEAENQRAREANQLRRDLAGMAAAARGSAQNLKKIPASAVKTLTDNQLSISRIEGALQAIDKAPGALGPSNMLGGEWLKNNVLGSTPEEQSARAGVADVGSLVLHDRSGAAVTISEFPRLRPFVPLPTDKPALAKQKLQRLLQMAREESDLYAANYGEDQGYTPYVVPGSVRSSQGAITGGSDSPQPQTVAPRLPGESIAAYRKRTGG